MALEKDKECELSHRARDLCPEHGFSYAASSEQFMTTSWKISFCSACGKQINSYLGKTVQCAIACVITGCTKCDPANMHVNANRPRLGHHLRSGM